MQNPDRIAKRRRANDVTGGPTTLFFWAVVRGGTRISVHSFQEIPNTNIDCLGFNICLLIYLHTSYSPTLRIDFLEFLIGILFFMHIPGPGL